MDTDASRSDEPARCESDDRLDYVPNNNNNNNDAATSAPLQVVPTGAETTSPSHDVVQVAGPQTRAADAKDVATTPPIDAAIDVTTQPSDTRLSGQEIASIVITQSTAIGEEILNLGPSLKIDFANASNFGGVVEELRKSIRGHRHAKQLRHLLRQLKRIADFQNAIVPSSTTPDEISGSNNHKTAFTDLETVLAEFVSLCDQCARTLDAIRRRAAH